jgi:hypothetical protein
VAQSVLKSHPCKSSASVRPNRGSEIKCRLQIRMHFKGRVIEGRLGRKSVVKFDVASAETNKCAVKGTTAMEITKPSTMAGLRTKCPL